MKKIKRKIFVFMVTTIYILNINLCTAEAYSKSNFRVSAHNAIAIDRETGQILFEQKGYELVPMASTTKILTALIAIQRGDLDNSFTVSKKAACVRGSKVGYKEGEQITIRELLYGLMYKSGNDAAITIAEGIGGSIEGFADIMNHYAVSLGLLDSHFESPHGLDSQDHYSSAYDLAILTAKGMGYDTFREIVGTKEIDKSKYNFTRSYNNINKILWKIPGANGVKTGYTGQAGKCLVSSINDNGKDIIIVVLNCPDRWNQTEKIYKYVQGINAYESMVMKELVKNQDEEYGFEKEEAQFEVRT
ncbi:MULTISPECIES: D-alanyl-D-alanine carboxypeptidase family protein [Clostridium]|uniref:D-alanyl-D-alanine carboxypeptidase n=1 Tax=Clostridium cibarium TaxID=2762247 RepID=A0ABR8PP95_9CLOT|nr:MULTISPECIES: D-alanyl-D-alanine carboxypeptidase family protein [Clostridium]MBD7909989.1 D-alanyl-D-alanine carboxypeptidase [Clostridium cibarium]